MLNILHSWKLNGSFLKWEVPQQLDGETVKIWKVLRKNERFAGSQGYPFWDTSKGYDQLPGSGNSDAKRAEAEKVIKEARERAAEVRKIQKMKLELMLGLTKGLPLIR